MYLLPAKSKCLCSRKTDFQLPVVVKFVVLLFDAGPASNLVVSEVKLSLDPPSAEMNLRHKKEGTWRLRRMLKLANVTVHLIVPC